MQPPLLALPLWSVALHLVCFQTSQCVQKLLHTSRRNYLTMTNQAKAVENEAYAAALSQLLEDAAVAAPRLFAKLGGAIGELCAEGGGDPGLAATAARILASAGGSIVETLGKGEGARQEVVVSACSSSVELQSFFIAFASLLASGAVQRPAVDALHPDVQASDSPFESLAMQHAEPVQCPPTSTACRDRSRRLSQRPAARLAAGHVRARPSARRQGGGAGGGGAVRPRRGGRAPETRCRAAGGRPEATQDGGGRPAAVREHRGCCDGRPPAPRRAFGNRCERAKVALA